MITIEHLYKSYGEQVIFSDLCLSLEQHCCTVILGASGIGKTTLFRLMLGLETADSGTIIFPSTMTAPQKTSAVFQEHRLCENLDCVSNILLPHLHKDSSLGRSQVESALSDLALGEHGGKAVKELSGGMKRRVAILRALLADYDILYLDEPFQGLDVDTKKRTMDYVKAQTQGKTVLCILHEAEELQYLTPKHIINLHEV